MEVGGATIIAESGPRFADTRGSSRGEVRERGKALQEAMPVSFDTDDLGLLQHDLRDEDLIRVARLAPGEIPAVLTEPLHQAAFEAQALRLRVGDGLGVHRRTR